MNSNIISYCPAAFYYRQEIEAARTKKELHGIARKLVLELERHKEWIREQGLIPPRWLVTPLPPRPSEEPLAEVIPFPLTAPACATAATREAAPQSSVVVAFANGPEASDVTGAAPKSSPAGRGSLRRG